MKYSKDVVARKKFHFLNANRGWPKNGPILVKLLEARHKQAKLLGFANWADYITADKMIGRGENVEKFLGDLDRLTRLPAHKDYQNLLRRKKKDEKGATAVYGWESSYYDNLLAEETIGYRTQEARAYFQFPRVKEAVLALAKNLFGLTFVLVKASMWHKEVETYDVFRRHSGDKGRPALRGRTGV
jgi:thimet oligopeptidase